mmetsp:Transcript_39107/g.80074  ORF Transcript_39107/g.80074 Transcript_39107/m.80074 type:complete len:194 (-) Transcript_39107:312-893(-)
MGAAKREVTQCPEGTMNVGRGRAHGEKNGKIVWQCEAAKLFQWRRRARANWTEMFSKVVTEAAQAQKAEERGFRMLAWPIVQTLSRKARCDILVGPTALEADPTIAWASAEEDCPFEVTDSPLILLDAVEPMQRREVLRQATQCQTWMIVTSKQDYGIVIQQQFKGMGDQHALLKKHSSNVYAKNWWRSGDKR